MSRFVPILIGVLVLNLGAASPVAAARTLSVQFTALGTATTDGCVEGGDPPCAETTVVSISGTVSGSPSPFGEINGFKSGNAVVSGHLEIRTDSYDAGTGCYMTMRGTLVSAVGRNVREAFAFVLSGVFCPGFAVGTFGVDSSATDLSLFRGATGSGDFQMRHGFTDLSISRTSAFDVGFNGSIGVRR
jgi:hypothetical protein